MRTGIVLAILLGYDLDIDLWPSGQRATIVMTYFYYKIKVKCQDLGHCPAKLLKCFRFVQNVFAFFLSIQFIRILLDYHILLPYCRVPVRQGLQQTRPGLRAATRHQVKDPMILTIWAMTAYTKSKKETNHTFDSLFTTFQGFSAPRFYRCFMYSVS